MYPVYIAGHVMVMCSVFLQKGQTALHVAASKNHVDIANMLLMQDSTLITLTDDVSEYFTAHIHVLSYMNLSSAISTNSYVIVIEVHNVHNATMITCPYIKLLLSILKSLYT